MAPRFKIPEIQRAVPAIAIALTYFLTQGLARLLLGYYPEILFYLHTGLLFLATLTFEIPIQIFCATALLIEDLIILLIFYKITSAALGTIFLHLVFIIVIFAYFSLAHRDLAQFLANFEEGQKERVQLKAEHQTLLGIMVQLGHIAGSSKMSGSTDTFFQLLQSQLGVEEASIYLIDAPTGELYLFSHFGKRPPKETVAGSGLKWNPQAGRGTEKPGTAYTLKNVCGVDFIPSLRAVPLIGKGQAKGVVILGRVSNDNLPLIDQWLGVVTSSFANSLENCRIFENSREDLAKLKALSDTYLEQKRKLSETFGRYIPRGVIEFLAQNPDRIKLGGYKEEVVVMFADIRGFTSMGERIKAEQIVQIINEWFTHATRIIEKNNGVIDKFIGDSIMVFFGAPVRRTDDITKAMEAAIQLQTFFHQFAASIEKRFGQKVGLGIGIATGEVLVGNIGSESRQDFTVIGRYVNLAARLEGEAGPGIILVDEKTHETLKKLYKFEALPGLELAGFQGGQTAYAHKPGIFPREAGTA